MRHFDPPQRFRQAEQRALGGLLDKRLSQISNRRASTAEVDQVVQTYRSGFAGWNVAHFESNCRNEFKDARSYSWFKTVLQGAGLHAKFMALPAPRECRPDHMKALLAAPSVSRLQA